MQPSIKNSRDIFFPCQGGIEKAEPKKPNPPSPSSKRYNDSRPALGGGFRDTYGGYSGSSYGGCGYRSSGAYSGRDGAYG